MSELARRDLLAAGLALSAAALLPRSAGAAAANAGAPDLSATAVTALAPREQLLFDFDWKFTFGHGTDPSKDLGFGYGQGDFAKTGDFKFAKTGFDEVKTWRSVNLPHDWAVELPFVNDDAQQSHGYKPLGRRYPETSVGWYRREFDIPKSDLGRRIWIEFDGAFRDVLVFVNGCFIGRNTNGYAPFRFDVTDFLAYGGKNVIALRVDASFGDGWFYEGAGVYRHLWLLKTDAVHLERWESVVRPKIDGDTAVLDLSATGVNTGAAPRTARVKWTIVDAAGTAVATADAGDVTIPAGGNAAFHATARIAAPRLWSLETPNLYASLVTLEYDGRLSDGERVDFGIRSAVFTTDKGFFLNGKPVKIQGVCNHQDHAGVGAALPDRLQAFRVGVMQSMDCNAIRTSHNMPTPELVAACDRMGVMLMCETRQMSSNPEGMAQLETTVKRYRNSPSVILWSIGNEEWLLQDKMAEQGAKVAGAMVRRCHELDPTRVVSAAVNGSNEKGVSEALDIIGFNYHQEFPEPFHKKYPNRPVFGSETSSAISTRGEYSSDAKRNTVSSYDGVVQWGASPEAWWKLYAQDWATGGFAWTGFDYRGEPTPYGWPSINSQFGITDMCGFPKDYFYYYKAWWGKAPSLHVFPHWNWAGKEGKEIPVWVYSNCDEVELIVNGKSLGRKPMPKLGHLEWKAVYAPGYIEARGFKDGKRILTERRETTGPATALRLSADRTVINADGEDVSVLRVEAFDAKGRPVPTANTKLAFKVAGAGTLIGVGNGDPNCLESDKAPARSLFNGLAQIIVQAGKQPGDIVIEATGDGLVPAKLTVTAKAAHMRAAVA